MTTKSENCCKVGVATVLFLSVTRHAIGKYKEVKILHSSTRPNPPPTGEGQSSRCSRA